MSYNTTNITIDNVTSTNVSRHGEGLCSEDYPDLDIYLEGRCVSSMLYVHAFGGITMGNNIYTCIHFYEI